MERIPEPELMEEEVQARAYARADFAEPHQRFVTLLAEAFPDLPGNGVALDLGCGPADPTIRFARAFPGWTIDGIDGAAAMLREGREAVARAGLAERVHLHEGRLPACEAPREAYDLVFSNAFLHHLADPHVLWSSVCRWAQPGTPVFVMDLSRPASPWAAVELVERYAADEPDVLRRDFHHSLLAAWQPDEVREQLEVADLGHLDVRAVGDRHLVIAGRR